MALAGPVFILCAMAGMASPAAVAAWQIAQLAPGGAPGIVNTVSFAPVTPGLSIAVTPFNDGSLDLQLKGRFEQELRRISRTTSDQAILHLSFETEMIEGTFATDERNLGSFEGSTQTGVQMQLNIWSSTRDSVLGGQRDEKERRTNVFHINAVLRDTRTGRYLWQGDAYCALADADPARVAVAMVRPLVVNLGRTVTGEPFEIE